MSHGGKPVTEATDLYGYEEHENEERPVNRVALGLAAAVALVALGWFVVRPAIDEDPETIVPIDESALQEPSGPLTGALPATSTTAAAPTSTSVSATTEASPTTDATTTETTVSTAAKTTTTTERTTTTTRPPRRTTTTTEPTTTTTRPRPTTTTTTEPEPRTYPTLPDGSPEPVVAIFDFDTITLRGNVPSKADRVTR